MITRKELAKKLGMKASTLNGLLNEKSNKGMGRALAYDKEQQTKIPRNAWMYPQEKIKGFILEEHLQCWCGELINCGRGRV